VNIWAKILDPVRAPFSALQLFFLCLVSPLLFAQASTSDIQQAAAAGNAQAQFAVANDYFRARYATLNYAEMLTWYRKSAAQGYAAAQNQLGSMYENNVGLPQDYKRAATYYRLAANQGLAPAQYNLAALFEAGRGVHRDYKKALTWYRKAADQSLSAAEKEVGYFYQCGLGIKRDYAQALAWYRRAADHGNSDAENQLGWMYQFGQGVGTDNAKALTWYGLAADQGNVQGKNNLQALTDDLQDRGGGEWQSATSAVSDAVIAQAQRWAKIRDLHARIDKAEADALYQDDLAEQLTHTGNGKSGAVVKMINAMGSVGAIKFHIEAEKYRTDAARLHDELAQIENQSSVGVPAP